MPADRPRHGRRPGSPARCAAPTASSASCASSAPASPSPRSEKDLLGALADMAAIAVRTARLHEAEEQWTIHAERDRIARELHDSLAQVLGVIHLQLRSLEARAKDEASLRHRRRAVRPRRDGRRGLQRRPRGDPRPARDGPRGRRPRGLAPRVPAQVQPPDGHRGDLTCEGDTRRALSPRSEVQLLRVVQEALTNTRKHADATRVTVQDRLPRRRHDAHDRGRWGRLRPHDRRRLHGRRLRPRLHAGAGGTDRRQDRRAYCAERGDEDRRPTRRRGHRWHTLHRSSGCCSSMTSPCSAGRSRR